MYVYVNLCVYACACVRACVLCVHVCVYVSQCVCVPVYLCTCIAASVHQSRKAVSSDNRARRDQIITILNIPPVLPPVLLARLLPERGRE